jgi:uncharacterized membrane protein YgcG
MEKGQYMQARLFLVLIAVVTVILAACSPKPRTDSSQNTEPTRNRNQSSVVVIPSATPQPISTNTPTRNPSIGRISATATETFTATANSGRLTRALTANATTPDSAGDTAPSNTPRPTEVETDTYYITGSTANVRECANSTTTCSVITALSYGDDIEVIERAEGVSVAGSTRWYRVLLSDGREGYVHSSLVSRTRPVAGNSGGSNSSSSSNSNSNNSGGGSTGASNPQPTAAPQVEPTQPPAPVSQYTCDCNKTCGSMTCDEAYFQLNTCGCQARDNDNDGVPCESVCSGG